MANCVDPQFVAQAQGTSQLMQMVDRSSLIRQMIERWRDDPGATYQSWFLWDERIKNFPHSSSHMALPK